MARGKGPKKKRDRKVSVNGVAHVKATFNNTIISIADADGQIVGWASAGKVGFKGSRKSTPFAAQLAAEDAAKQVLALGMRKVDVHVKGPGAGRESAGAKRFPPRTQQDQHARHRRRNHRADEK